MMKGSHIALQHWGEATLSLYPVYARKEEEEAKKEEEKEEEGEKEEEEEEER